MGVRGICESWDLEHTLLQHTQIHLELNSERTAEKQNKNTAQYVCVYTAQF